MKTGDSGEDYRYDDPLPDGWTVKAKSTTSGKKYKCYFSPTGECKFYSKLEVVRYLNKNNPKSEVKEEEKDIDQHSSKKFVVEKSEPDDLPPGWIKEIKVTKKGDKIRRDPYYTDPVSGYVFRSMKDARQYLETGKLGRLAFKPKDKGNDNVELEDDKACESAVAKKQKLAVNGTTSRLIGDQSLKLIDVDKDARVLRSAGELRAEFDNFEVPEDDRTGGKSDCIKSAIVTAVDDSLSEQILERGLKDEIAETEHGKSKKKKDLNLPRRASKRLAGLPLDPSPELKTTNRTRPAAVKQLDDTVASTDESSSHVKQEAELASETSKTKKKPESNKGKHPIREIPAPGEVEIKNNDNKKHECSSMSPSGNLTISEELAREVEIDNNVDGKPGMALDLALGEFWQDPCIAFAIKTLTGISSEHPESIQISSGSNNSELGGLSALEDSARKEDSTDIRDQKKLVQRSSNITAPVDHKERLRSPLNIPFINAWSDPCIQFAIKTLTGVIPLNHDTIVQDYVQQKTGSSQSQESSGLTLQNIVGPGQAENFYLQYSISEQPIYDQGALPHTKNMNLG